MILFLKAVRAVWRHKGAYVSCVILIALSVFMLTAMGAAARALDEAATRFYKTNRLADVFATVNSLPAAELSSLRQIEGIDEVQARISYETRLIMPGLEKTVWLRLISYDAITPGVPLNAPNVYGRDLTERYDIWLGQTFLDTHHLEEGGTLTAIIEGREITLTIAGSAISPEYVYAVRDPSDMFPDTEAFGIAFIAETDLSLLLNRRNTYSDISLTLDNGYNLEDVKPDLEAALSPFGLTSLIDREDQFSFAMVDQEIQSTSAQSYTTPIIFAGIAAVVLYLMLKRIIEQERTQIGVLKTFGYSNAEILFHYLWYGLVTGLLGAVLGIALGSLAIRPLVVMYTEFFVLPDIADNLPLDLAAIGLLGALAFGALGAYGGAKSAVKLQPADALRPPSPPVVKGDIMKTIPWLKFILTSRGSMAMRNIMRAKARSVFIVAGIMFSFGMLAMMCPLMSSMTDIILSKYVNIQAYHAKLSLIRPAPVEDAERLAHRIPGVTVAEPLRELPVQMRYSNRKTGTFLVGLRPETILYRLYDDDKKLFYRPPRDGIVINTYSAKELGVKRGDTVLLTTAYNPDEDEEIAVTIRGIVSQNMTSAAYMDAAAINAMLNLPDEADAVMVRTNDLSGLKAYINDAKNIRAIEDTQGAIKNFSQMMNSYSAMTWIMVLIGAGMAFAIIYNSATISLSEKKREYATLRVLGMQVGEVCEILRFEYWLLFLVGCLLGIPFAYWLQSTMNSMMSEMMDNFSLPSAIPNWALGMAFLGCMGAVMLSNLSAKRTIRKLDMVEVLKERE